MNSNFACRYFDPAIGLPDGIFPYPDPPITLLRGGSPGQRERLLEAACREAANRDLSGILLYRPDRRSPAGALLGDRLLLTDPLADLPILRREVSLCTLTDYAALEARRGVLSALDGQIAKLDGHLRLLTQADRTLSDLAESAAEGCVLKKKLAGFAARLIERLKIPAGTGDLAKICVCRPAETPPRPDSPAFGIAPRSVMGISDRVGIGGKVLTALSAEAGRRGADRVEYTGGAGRTVGLFLPAVGLYIGGESRPPARPINCARFADQKIARQIRPLLRSIACQRRELLRLADDRREKIADLSGKIDEIFDNALRADAFADFSKDFLITFFCG